MTRHQWVGIGVATLLLGGTGCLMRGEPRGTVYVERGGGHGHDEGDHGEHRGHDEGHGQGHDEGHHGHD